MLTLLGLHGAVDFYEAALRAAHGLSQVSLLPVRSVRHIDASGLCTTRIDASGLRTQALIHSPSTGIEN